MNLFKVAWHEIRATLRTPSFYFVAALFLFYQGIVFSVTIALRHHPLSPPGPLLAPFFGGPFWFWPLLILVVVELSHGTLSRERTEGTLDLLLASPASPTAVVVGKYLGIAALFALLWLMTLPMMVLLFIYLPSSTHVAVTPIVTGYLGAMLVGSTGLALGLFFSSLTRDTRLSGMLTFVVLFLLVLIKILVNRSYGIITSPGLIKALSYVNFLDYMETFARGNIKGVHLMALLGVIVLSVKGAAMVIGHKQRLHPAYGLVDMGVWAIIFVLLTLAMGVGNRTWYGDSREIDPRLAERLDALKQPVEVYLFSSASTSNLHFSPLPKIESSLNTFAGRSSSFSWQRVGVHRPGLAERRLAERFGLKLELLQRDRTGLEEGVLVVSMGGRFKSIPLSTIVTADVQGQRIRFKGIRLEAEIASALTFLSDPVSLTLCVSGGHGEHSITDPGPLGLSRLMTSFRATGWSVRELSPLVSPIPAKCQLLLIAGPTKEFLPSEAEAVESWLLQQRGVVVTMDESGEFPGRLREMLGRWNIFPARERLLDMKKSVGKSGGWLWASLVKGSLEDKNWRVVVEGPREIEAREGVQALIESSDKVRRVSPSALNQRALTKQRAGKALIGVINTDSTPGRLAVLGFTLGLLNRSLDKRGESSDSSVELIRYLAAWGARRNTEVAIPEVAVIHHHLHLKSSHINSLQLFAMLLLPLIALSIGIWVGFKRRR